MRHAFFKLSVNKNENANLNRLITHFPTIISESPTYRYTEIDTDIEFLCDKSGKSSKAKDKLTPNVVKKKDKFIPTDVRTHKPGDVSLPHLSKEEIKQIEQEAKDEMMKKIAAKREKKKKKLEADIASGEVKKTAIDRAILSAKMKAAKKEDDKMKAKKEEEKERKKQKNLNAFLDLPRHAPAVLNNGKTTTEIKKDKLNKTVVTVTSPRKMTGIMPIHPPRITYSKAASAP